MIAHHQRCICCGRPATRTAANRPDRRGIVRPIALCRRCPSPLEIDQQSRRISDTWSDAERYSRFYGCGVQHVARHRRVYYDRQVYTLAEAVRPAAR